MTPIEIKLITLATITKRDPLWAVPRGGNLTADCRKVSCDHHCPFYGVDFGCDSPDPGSKEYTDSSIRTYDDVLAILSTHPELFL